MFVFCILSFRRSHITQYFYFHSFPSSRAIDSRRLCQRSRACLHSLAQESKIVWKKLAPVSNGSKTKSTVSHFLTKTNDVRIPRRVPGKRKFHEEESAPRIEGSKKQEPVASRPVKPLGATTAVSPSPLPSSAIATNGTRNTVRQQAAAPESHPEVLSGSAEVKLLRGGPQQTQSSWKVEKRAQKTLQQSAFRREKDNPFLLYSYFIRSE